MIHPTAVIHPRAQLGRNVTIGPYAVIDEGVSVGADCQVGPHVYLTGLTQIGARTRIHAGAVIGDWPQDVRFKGEPTGVSIGEDNVIREHVTIHRSNKAAEPTRIGSHCLLMAHAHVGHNSVVGSHVIVANGALIAGHVTVDERVFISGNCLLHQFTRVGAFALMQGGSAISKDLPPYTIARGDNGMAGLNVAGLRRAGFSTEDRLELRRLYHLVFRRGLKLREAVAAARREYSSARAALLLDFLESGRRGFCTDRARRDQSRDAES